MSTTPMRNWDFIQDLIPSRRYSLSSAVKSSVRHCHEAEVFLATNGPTSGKIA